MKSHPPKARTANQRSKYLANLTAQVIQRCGEMCEYCASAPSDVIFHRHWRTFLAEWPEDVMMICFRCRAFIMKSPASKTPKSAAGSLHAEGDLGFDNTQRWSDYLKDEARRSILLRNFMMSLTEEERTQLAYREAQR